MSDQKATNVTWHEHRVSTADREKLMGHRGALLWFTGLSGAGKSTVANTVDHMLHERGVHTYVLDGDNVRMGLNARTWASRPEDRTENIRRIGEVAQALRRRAAWSAWPPPSSRPYARRPRPP